MAEPDLGVRYPPGKGWAVAKPAVYKPVLIPVTLTGCGLNFCDVAVPVAPPFIAVPCSVPT